MALADLRKTLSDIDKAVGEQNKIGASLHNISSVIAQLDGELSQGALGIGMKRNSDGLLDNCSDSSSSGRSEANTNSRPSVRDVFSLLDVPVRNSIPEQPVVEDSIPSDHLDFGSGSPSNQKIVQVPPTPSSPTPETPESQLSDTESKSPNNAIISKGSSVKTHQSNEVAVSPKSRTSWELKQQAKWEDERKKKQEMIDKKRKITEKKKKRLEEQKERNEIENQNQNQNQNQNGSTREAPLGTLDIPFSSGSKKNSIPIQRQVGRKYGEDGKIRTDPAEYSRTIIAVVGILVVILAFLLGKLL